MSGDEDFQAVFDRRWAELGSTVPLDPEDMDLWEAERDFSAACAEFDRRS